MPHPSCENEEGCPHNGRATPMIGEWIKRSKLPLHCHSSIHADWGSTDAESVEISLAFVGGMTTRCRVWRSRGPSPPYLGECTQLRALERFGTHLLRRLYTHQTAALGHGRLQDGGAENAGQV